MLLTRDWSKNSSSSWTLRQARLFKKREESLVLIFSDQEERAARRSWAEFPLNEEMKPSPLKETTHDENSIDSNLNLRDAKSQRIIENACKSFLKVKLVKRRKNSGVFECFSLARLFENMPKSLIYFAPFQSFPC